MSDKSRHKTGMNHKGTETQRKTYHAYTLCLRPLGDTLFRQRNSPDVFVVNKGF